MPESAEGVDITPYKTEEIQVNGQPFKIEFNRGEDGRFVANAVDIPDAMADGADAIAYGATEEEALQALKDLIQEILDSGALDF